ncbi:MAG: hypothetical protein ABW168_27145, partial [Sedimenticola sp.]
MINRKPGQRVMVPTQDQFSSGFPLTFMLGYQGEFVLALTVNAVKGCPRQVDKPQGSVYSL